TQPSPLSESGRLNGSPSGPKICPPAASLEPPPLPISPARSPIRRRAVSTRGSFVTRSARPVLPTTSHAIPRPIKVRGMLLAWIASPSPPPFSESVNISFSPVPFSGSRHLISDPGFILTQRVQRPVRDQSVGLETALSEQHQPGAERQDQNPDDQCG